MVAILGISAFYHDSAAALVVEGRIVAAAQEERFSRIKHDASFPARAIEYCLAAGGVAVSDLDYVAFYDKPLLKFERLLETWLAVAPRGFLSFCDAIPSWLSEKLNVRRMIRRQLQGLPANVPLVFPEHHESHAASAFFPSPFEQAAILTIDGVGEWATASYGVGEGNHIRLLGEMRFPHSLGLLYSAFTAYCGFAVNDGEYKLMGLAPYGQPRFEQVIREKLLDLRPDGSFRLNMKYFDHCFGQRMTNANFDRLFGGPPRRGEAQIEARHLDAAASVQAVTEEIVRRMSRHVLAITRQRDLVLAGGVALNCVANGKLVRDDICRRLWIQPAAGDAGGALGAALFVWHQLLKQPRAPENPDSQQGSLLGPEFSREEILQFLDSQDARYHLPADEDALVRAVAAHLAAGRIVGWFQGRMEFGPRALGSRSILADPRRADMQSRLNQQIKRRESFRPFAPAVLAEHAHEYFDLPPGCDSPYMLLTADVREAHRRELSAAEQNTMVNDPDLLRRVNVARSSIPAVTHVDCSARLQTVDDSRNPVFYRLLQAFYRQTGCPVLINTSLNVRGEPIVCTPADAWHCFQETGIDVLVLGDAIIEKQPSQNSVAVSASLEQTQLAVD
jgi:carbamoyltransferase